MTTTRVGGTGLSFKKRMPSCDGIRKLIENGPSDPTVGKILPGYGVQTGVSSPSL